MNRHVASAFAYVSTVAAATVAAALMATSAFAEGPILLLFYLFDWSST